MAETFRVEGLRGLLAATSLLPKETQREVRRELRRVAEPVRAEAQARFLSDVSADQGKTRYGISVRKVGTISVEQRVKGKNRARQYRRPKFTDLVWQRSLSPAFRDNQREIISGFDRAIANIERIWGR